MPDPRFETETFEREGGLTYSGEVIDAFFSTGQYGTSLNIVTRVDNPELYPWMKGGTHTRFYAIGNSKDGNWTPVNDGKGVVFRDLSGQDMPKKINRGSAYGKLLHYFEEHDEVGKALPPSFRPLDASGWIGLHITWDNVDQPVRRRKLDPNTGAELDEWFNTTAKVPMPVRITGGATPGGNGATPTPTPEPVFEPFAVDVLGLPDDMLANIKGVAMVTNTYADFMGNTLKVEGVVNNPALMKVLQDHGEGERLHRTLAQG